MKGFKRAALVVAALLALAISAVAGLHLTGFLDARLRRLIESRAARALGGEVTVARLDLSFFPPGVRLQDVRAAKKGNRGSDATGSAGRVVIRAGPLTFLGLRRGPVTLEVEKPALRVVLAEGRPVVTEASAASGSLSLLAQVPPESSLRIDDGAISLEYVNGMRCRLDGVDALVRPGPAPGMARGHLEFHGGEAHGPPGDWDHLGGEIDFDVTNDGLRLEPLSLRGGGLAVSGGLRARLDPSLTLEGELRAGAQVDTLARYLPAGAAPAGRAEARLKGSWGPDGARAEGELNGVALRFFGVDVDSLRSDVAIDGTTLHLAGIRAHVLGGEATGSLEAAPLKGGWTTRIDVQVDGVDLAQLLKLAGWSGPAVRGTVHYRGRHEIGSDGIASLRGSGVLDTVGHYVSPRGVDLPLEIASKLETSGGTIDLSGGTIRAGAVRGSFSGSVAPGEGVRLRLSGATGDISQILPLFARPPRPKDKPAPRGPRAGKVPASARPVRLVAWSADPPPESDLERIVHALGGRWEWDGDLAYDRRGLSFAGRLVGDDLTYHGTGLGRLEARVLYRDDDLTIRDAILTPVQGGIVRPSGAIGFREGGSMAIEAEATDCPVAPMLALAGWSFPLEARVNARVGLGGRPLAPTGHASVESGPLLLAGIPFDGLKGDLLFTPDLLEVGGLLLSRGPGTLRLAGRIPYRGKEEGDAVEAGAEPQRLSITGRGLDLARAGSASGWIALAGTLEIDGTVGGGLDAPAGAITLRGEGVAIGGTTLGAVVIEATLGKDRVELQASAPERRIEVAGTIGLGGEWPADLRATLSGTEMKGQLVPGALDEASLVASGEAEIRGPLLERGGLHARATLTSLACGVSGVTVSARAAVEATMDGTRLRLAPLVLAGDGTEIELGGSLDVGDEGTVDLSARGTFDLRLLRAFLKNLQATGQGEIGVRVTGARAHPAVEGRLKVAAEAIRYPDLPFPINDLEASGSFAEDRLRIESLTLQAGGGPVEGRGEVVLGAPGGSGAPFAVRRADVRLAGKGVKAEFPEGFRSVSDLDLTFHLDPEGAVLKGSIDLVKGIYSHDFRIGSSIARGRGEGPLALPPPQGPIASLGLDLRIRSAGDVWLRNDFGSVEGAGELEVKGAAARPRVAGRITATEGGTIRFRNVRYRVQRGTLDFADPERINPFVDLEAETTVSEYQVTLRIEGTADNFKYELTSTPPLPQQDIVALLLTGRTLGGLGADHRAFGEETVSAYLSGRFTEELSGRLSGRAGLDVIAVDPLQVNGQGDPTARVTIGKQITPDLFITYSNDLGSTQGSIYQVDYSLDRNLKLTSLRDRDGSIGGDLRYILRGKPPSLPGLQEAAPPSDRPILEAIRLDGRPRFAEARALRRLRLKPGRPRDRAAVNDGVDRLLKFYRDRGYLMAEVDVEEAPAGPGRVGLAVHLRPGPRVRIELEGMRGREGLRQKIAPFWQKGIFLDDIVEAARGRLETLYRDRGYQGARVTATVLRSDEEAFTVRFGIDRGPRVRASEVRVAGARQIDEKEVLKVVGTGPDTLFSRGLVKDSQLRDDASAIRDLYLGRGFPRVVVEPSEVVPDDSGRRAAVVFHVEEGPRVILHAIRFEGARSLSPDRLLEAATLRPGGPYTTDAADAAAARLRRAYDDGGFPDVRVHPRLETVVRDGDAEQADLVFTVEEGDRQTVRSVEVDGNLITHEEVVRKALTFKPGEPLSRSDMLESQRRLYQRGIFSSVSVEPVTTGPPAPDGDPAVPRDVQVAVREAAPLTQVFGLGYDSEEKTRGQYEISDRNIFGSGRYLGLQTRASALNQIASLQYREMGVFGGHFDALASTFWEDERRPGFDVRTIGTSVQFSRQVTRATRLLYRYSLKDVDLSNASADFEGTTLRLGSVSSSAVHDTRDAPFDPLRGHYLSGELQLFSQALGSEATFSKGYAQIYYFKEVLPKTVWAQALRAGAARTYERSRRDPPSTGDALSGVPPSERFFAGGDTTLRGFRRDRVGPLDDSGNPVGGEGLFLLNEELRFPIFRDLQGVVFYDAGNVFRTLSEYDPTDLRQVAGAGLRVATPIGPFRFEYGAILDRKADEPRGQFFISIGQAF